MKYFIVSVPSQKKLNTYGVDLLADALPGGSFLANPRAIKRTTRTELRRCDIRNGKCIHWNNGAIPTALHRYNI